MTSVCILDEPKLQFRYGQELSAPHQGLSLFGPFDSDSPSHPRKIIYAVVGAPEGLDLFRDWSRAMQCAHFDADERKARLWPPFPGFGAIFGCEWPTAFSQTYSLDRQAVINASRLADQDKRTFKVVELYLESITTAQKRDESIGVFVCIVPDEVWVNCRSKSRVSEPIGQALGYRERHARRQGQTHLFDAYDPSQYLHSPDFRRQLKARAMSIGIPIQIVRESTLRMSDTNDLAERGLTPVTDRMWNLSTTLFYKSGGKPWKLAAARDGVCYIGIAFRRTGTKDKDRTACCAAQMFLDTGDGIVFLGESGMWYSPEAKQCHLSGDAANRLLKGVLETYAQLDGRALTEIFLHSRSTIDEAEFEGYQAACPPGVRIAGVRVKPEQYGIRLYRPGNWPVIRGTFLAAGRRTGFLWTTGFKDSLGTYDGWDTPIPLRIDIQHGEADIEQVAKDVLALTKLNYNSCRLGDSQPVTVGFSDAVGEILVSNPSITRRSPLFKFYI